MKREIRFKENFKEYWGVLKNYKRMFWALILIIFIGELLNFIPKILFKKLIDDGTLFGAGTLSREIFLHNIYLISGAFILTFLIFAVINIFTFHMINVLDEKLSYFIKNKYFNHVLRLDHNFHTTHKTGSLISKLIRGTDAIRSLTDKIAFNFIPLIIQIGIVGFSFAYFSMTSSFIVLIVMFLSIFFNQVVQNKLTKTRIVYNMARDFEKGNIADYFTNIDSIKYFGKSKYVEEKHDDLTKDTKEKHLMHLSNYKWLYSGQNFLFSLGSVFLLIFPMISFIKGDITLGTVSFIYLTYATFASSVKNFNQGLRDLQKVLADVQDLFNYKKIENAVPDNPNSKNIQIKRGEVSFENISFNYGKRNLIREFSLKIKNGEKVALVGYSGSGKTTLIKLLYRLYDVDSGSIKIDEYDVKDFKQEFLRGEMSIVPQECVLFDDTIYNNIKFSKPSAKREEILRAIKFSQLDKLIKEMPDKENTVVGERGVKLSGGEKQRVSIARAILANKKILVLDEATSALDSVTEHEIQKDLEKLMNGRTSIIIAHRLSTIMKADRIIVMSNGKIVQSGTHRQLINQEGQYKKLWNMQKGGYIK